MFRRLKAVNPVQGACSMTADRGSRCDRFVKPSEPWACLLPILRVHGPERPAPSAEAPLPRTPHIAMAWPAHVVMCSVTRARIAFCQSQESPAASLQLSGKRLFCASSVDRHGRSKTTLARAFPWLSGPCRHLPRDYAGETSRPIRCTRQLYHR